MAIKASLIIANFNQEKYVEQAVRSAIDQVCDFDYEVIVVDDASSDNSKNILSTIKSERLKIVLQPTNQGQSCARNVGLHLAQGTFIIFLDSDDYIHPSYLRLMCESMESNKSDLAVCDFAAVWTSEPNPNEVNFASVIKGNVEASTLLKSIICGKSSAVVWDKAFRKDLIETHGIRFKEGIFNEDILFNTDYLLHSSLISSVPQILYYYRQNPLSTTKKFSRKIFDDMLKVKIALMESFRESRLPEKEIDEYKAHFISYFICRIGLYRLRKMQTDRLAIFLQIAKESHAGLSLRWISQAQTSTRDKVTCFFFKSFGLITALSAKVFRRTKSQKIRGII